MQSRCAVGRLPRGRRGRLTMPLFDHGFQSSETPNHAMERTADRCASTFEMTSTLPLRATRAPVRRRSSCYR
jgi:hypothetical protein